MPTRHLIRQPGLIIAAAAAAWTPASLSPIGWWDASDAATITASAGRVSQWDNKGSGGFPVVQPTGGLQPLTGSHTMNSVNTIYFSYSRGDYLHSGANPMPGATAGSLLYVAKQLDAATNYGAPVNGPASTIDSWYPFGDGNRYENFGSTVRKSWANGATFTTAHQAVIVSASGAYDVYHNGSSVFTTGTNTTTFSSDISFADNAATGNFGGDISEIVLCSTAISSGDRASWATYCAAKWGTP